MKNKVFSVTQINTYIKRMFQSDYALRRISIKGQVSNCKYHSSGHIYFSLKDEGSQISCVMFANARYDGLKFELEDGQEVVVDGNISVYERGGSYQLYAQEIRLNGIGELYVAYEMLKQKLYEEGLFDHEKKKPIPKNPKKIGVVTARTGAAIPDIISTAKRRNPYVQLVLYPAKVQGDGASDTIVAGIKALDQYGVDIIIVGRGGGSIEDLWAFNEEMVARAIFESKIPIISAVGHETDFTIADFIADMRAPTPSAAAEIAIPENEGMSLAVINNYKRLNYLMDIILSSGKNNLQTLSTKHCFTGFADNIYDNEIYVSQLQNRLISKIQNKIEFANQTLKHKIDNLGNISPLKILQKGYSLTYNDKQKLIRSTESVNIGDKINVVLNDGNITATVEEVRNNNGYEENI